MHQHIEECSRQIPVNGGKLVNFLRHCLYITAPSHGQESSVGSTQPLFTIRGKTILFIFLASSTSAQSHFGGHVECGVSFLDGLVGIGRDKCGLGKSLYEYHSFGIDFNKIGHTNHTNG